MKQAAICILDGMGPQAGGYLYNTLINKAVRDYGVKNNNDYPEIILHSIPVPDFISDDCYRSEALSKYGITTVIPSKRDLRILENIVRNILKGKRILDNKSKLRKIADCLKKKGAQGIILGCTELPLLFPTRYNSLVYNSVDILASTLLQKYYKQNTME